VPSLYYSGCCFLVIQGSHRIFSFPVFLFTTPYYIGGLLENWKTGKLLQYPLFPSFLKYIVFGKLENWKTNDYQWFMTCRFSFFGGVFVVLHLWLFCSPFQKCFWKTGKLMIINGL